jgi:protocatechuate 3,4-dioxygenase beta subunit
MRTGAAGAAGLLLLGCKQDGGAADGGADGAAAADADPLAPDASPCPISEANIEGPFYTPGAPEDVDLVEPGEPGVRLTLSGTVSGHAACERLAGAIVDVWHCDDAGAYDDAGFSHRGVLVCDDQGRYSLRTIIPGHYLNGNTYRPAHIHVKVGATGHQLLTTQLYFEGDEFNDGDPFILPSLIMPLTDEADGSRSATFDFVLRPV